MAKAFIVFGIFLTLIGILMLYKVNFSWIGKLPGDFFGSVGKAKIYFPFITCLLASMILSLFSYLFALFKKK
ncbi:hypothetical protein COB11_02575 [Candidatus Aerophobetes bacterium]|uniref:DUF2905 domain-containing protein n=1 Tax=Aerophobetes bacterium TaxID=2030807 RepID=A0A2A4YKU7_UNCAE|nr:MAG: hypothetical protein COB11_02575 [Candidatus Aerophobetes bacterium]